MPEIPADPEVGPKTFKILSLVWPIYLPSFLAAMGMGMTIPVLPLFARELGAGLGLTGVVVMFKGIGGMAADLPSGLLVSRLGSKGMMLAAAALFCLVSAGAGLSRNVALLAVFVFCGGVAQSSWMMARLSLLKEIVPSRRRGRSLSLVGGVMRIGVFVGPIAGGFLADRFGMRAAFFGQAFLSLAAGLLVALKVRGGGRGPVREVSAIGRIRETVGAHWNTFLRYGSAILALGLLRSGRQILFPLWGDHIGLDLSAIGLVFGLASALDMTLFYPAGYIMDRFGRKWAAAPCMILLSASLALLPLTRGFGAMLLVSLLGGLGNGLGSGIVITTGSDLAPKHQVGEFLGVWRLINDIGGFAAPLIVGVIAQAITLGLASIFAAAVGAVGVSILILFAKESSPRHR